MSSDKPAATPSDPELLNTLWTDEQVDALNRYQQRRDFHPYTCGTDSSHRPLLATNDGWKCLDCDYRQTWALAGSVAMADRPSVLDELKTRMPTSEPAGGAAKGADEAPLHTEICPECGDEMDWDDTPVEPCNDCKERAKAADEIGRIGFELRSPPRIPRASTTAVAAVAPAGATRTGTRATTAKENQ